MLRLRGVVWLDVSGSVSRGGSLGECVPEREWGGIVVLCGGVHPVVAGRGSKAPGTKYLPHNLDDQLHPQRVEVVEWVLLGLRGAGALKEVGLENPPQHVTHAYLERCSDGADAGWGGVGSGSTSRGGVGNGAILSRAAGYGASLQVSSKKRVKRYSGPPFDDQIIDLTKQFERDFGKPLEDVEKKRLTACMCCAPPQRANGHASMLRDVYAAVPQQSGNGEEVPANGEDAEQNVRILMSGFRQVFIGLQLSFYCRRNPVKQEVLEILAEVGKNRCDAAKKSLKALMKIQGNDVKR